jgi:hypothetical protein
LVAIEASTPALSLGGITLDLLDETAETLDDIKVLVDRFAESRALDICANLALLLAMRADLHDHDLAQTTLHFYVRARFYNHERVLHSVLEAVKLSLINGYRWEPTKENSATVAILVERGLRTSPDSTQSEFVKQSAIQTLRLLIEKGLLQEVFDSSSLDRLRSALSSVNQDKSELIQKELSTVRSLFS